MPTLMSELKQEITRLARKEAKAETATLKKQSAQYRRDIAALKRQVDAQAKEIAFLQKQEKRRLAKEPSPEIAEDVRYSAAWVKGHREKLGLSAKDYGRLVGVSSLTIYNWEAGKSKPRKQQLAGWAAIRNLRKRDALARLEMLD